MQTDTHTMADVLADPAKYAVNGVVVYGSMLIGYLDEFIPVQHTDQ